jgi:hypothetical protein
MSPRPLAARVFGIVDAAVGVVVGGVGARRSGLAIGLVAVAGRAAAGVVREVDLPVAVVVEVIAARGVAVVPLFGGIGLARAVRIGEIGQAVGVVVEAVAALRGG